MIVDTNNIESIIAFLVMLVSALFAWWQNREKNTVMEAYISGSPASVNPAVIAKLPDRSWRMTESTKRWLTFDATPENKATILAQIEEAEANRETHYTIGFDGGFYEIDYGLLKGGGGAPSGK